MNGNTREEMLKSVYEQHWLHARHLENERLWFTNIFGVIVAGLLAFMGTVGDTNLSQFVKYTGFFIFTLSLLGYFLCITWRAAFVEHTTLANKILKRDALLSIYAPYSTSVYKKIKIGWVTAYELFLYFYAIMAGAALSFALLIGLSWRPYGWIGFMATVILGASCRCCLLKREKEYRRKMGADKW